MSSEVFQDLSTYVRGNPEAKKLALVLPGLCDTQAYPHMRDLVDYLAGQGMYAVSFDMPGTWQSTADIRDLTITNCLAAINRVIEAVDKPTVAIGHSNGGRLAVLAALQNPRIEAVVCMMSAAKRYSEKRVTAWRKAGREVLLRDDPAKRGTVRLIAVPVSFCEDSLQYNGAEGLEGPHVPILFIAAESDEHIPLADIQDTYLAAAPPKKLVTVKSTHHYGRHRRVVREIRQLVGDFLVEQHVIARPL